MGRGVHTHLVRSLRVHGRTLPQRLRLKAKPLPSLASLKAMARRTRSGSMTPLLFSSPIRTPLRYSCSDEKESIDLESKEGLVLHGTEAEFFKRLNMRRKQETCSKPNTSKTRWCATGTGRTYSPPLFIPRSQWQAPQVLTFLHQFSGSYQAWCHSNSNESTYTQGEQGDTYLCRLGKKRESSRTEPEKVCGANRLVEPRDSPRSSLFVPRSSGPSLCTTR